MMLNDNVRPRSLGGIKRLATQIKKHAGVKHSDALDLAARAASYSNYAAARRQLISKQVSTQADRELFLTIYWQDRETRSIGRETLQIFLSRPLLEICTKGEMKLIRGLGWMRLVAADHLVSDDVIDSQSSARELICKAVRALRFMEHTGLRPLKRRRARTEPEKLPRSDHATNWWDSTHGQFILIDEPYGGDPDDPDRQAWAEKHKWHLRLSRWQGMYFPPHCNMFVATSAETGYDFEALMARINKIPQPVRQERWTGISNPTHETFVSPAAVTPQDRRRAKSQGTVFRHPTSTTVPYHPMFGTRRRKPAGRMGIPNHIEAGQMIKSILRSRATSWGVESRLNSLRSTLEDWLGLEIGRDELPGPEFFDVYYHEADEDGPYWPMAQSREGTVQILAKLKSLLESSYPDCEPLRRQTARIDRCMTLVLSRPTRSFDT